MKDWIERLDEFLQINRKDILKDAGRISHELAVEIAEKNFDEYKKNEVKQVDDDFDLVDTSLKLASTMAMKKKLSKKKK